MSDYPLKRYGQWAGYPTGVAYNPNRCAYPVSDGRRTPFNHQCSKPKGHGDRGLFCKQHARKFPAAEKEIDGGAL